MIISIKNTAGVYLYIESSRIIDIIEWVTPGFIPSAEHGSILCYDTGGGQTSDIYLKENPFEAARLINILIDRATTDAANAFSVVEKDHKYLAPDPVPPSAPDPIPRSSVPVCLQVTV